MTTPKSAGRKVVFGSGYPTGVVANLGLPDRDTLFLPKPFAIESVARILRSDAV